MASDAATKRTLEKQICTRCDVHNPQKAKRCHKCGYKHLRPKLKERRAA